MIGACQRFVKRRPNLAMLVIGLWFVVAPVTFGVYFRDLTSKNGTLSGTDALLELFLFNHKQSVAIVFAMMHICGMGLVGVAIYRMLRSRIRN